MYQCSNCRHIMSYPQDRCPACSVLLSGVRCQGCGYVGEKQKFISNNHRCPECGSVVKISGKPSGDCFVATEVYGNPHCAEVQALRRFRDTYLSKSLFGRWLIHYYYNHGPSWARGLHGRDRVKTTIRITLDTIVSVIGKYFNPM